LNPRLVIARVSGYGQTGPAVGRSGHDLNYLGLNGLLGLSGEPDGPPVQAAGQIADLGGGALMAAVGVLIALRERERFVGAEIHLARTTSGVVERHSQLRALAVLDHATG